MPSKGQYLKITTGKNTGEKNQGEMLYARLFCQTPFLIKIRNNSQRPSLDLPILVLLPPLIFSMTCSSFFSPPPLSNPPFFLLLPFPPQLLGRRYTDSISYFSRPGVKRGKRKKVWCLVQSSGDNEIVLGGPRRKKNLVIIVWAARASSSSSSSSLSQSFFLP